MAQIKGLINAKGKSGEIIANNGAYFVDLTNATESSGVYTIPSADIGNGDFTLQVGDTLIDKDSGSMLKVATLTPSITASLVFEASSGGGGSQLYQHNICLLDSTYKQYISLTIINDSNVAFDKTSLTNYIYTKFSNSNPMPCSAVLYFSNTNHIASSLWFNFGFSDTYYLRFYGIGNDGNIMSGDITSLDSFTLTDTIIPL